MFAKWRLRSLENRISTKCLWRLLSASNPPSLPIGPSNLTLLPRIRWHNTRVHLRWKGCTNSTVCGLVPFPLLARKINYVPSAFGEGNFRRRSNPTSKGQDPNVSRSILGSQSLLICWSLMKSRRNHPMKEGGRSHGLFEMWRVISYNRGYTKAHTRPWTSWQCCQLFYWLLLLCL